MLPSKNKILTIAPYKNNTYKITTSSGINLRVSKEILLKIPLNEGKELTQSDIDEIKSIEDYFTIRGVALRLLDYRMRSKKELEIKLFNKGYNKNSILKVIKELEQKGWLDDEKFCLAFSKDQINRNKIGPIALKYKLKEYIDSFSLIEKISEKIYTELNIENVIMQVLVNHPPEKIKKEDNLKKRLFNRLKCKGHYWQDIDGTLNKYLNS